MLPVLCCAFLFFELFFPFVFLFKKQKVLLQWRRTNSYKPVVNITRRQAT